MQYEIISTGSKGNCVILENSIAIDMGISYKALKPYMRELQIVLLTHTHQDHANRSTIKRLASERPCLRFGCGEWMVPLLVECGVQKKNIDVYEFDKPWSIEVGDITFAWIKNFPLFHDVSNCGWKISVINYEWNPYNGAEPEYLKALYATDTSKILTEAKDFDLYLVEANYEDEEVQERIDQQIIAGKDYIHEYKAMRNHLSHQAMLDFVAANAGPNSLYVPLHGHRREDKQDENSV